VAERLDDLLSSFDVTALERDLSSLFASGHISDMGACLADRLSGRKSPNPGSAPHA